jgi:hypothetical protein
MNNVNKKLNKIQYLWELVHLLGAFYIVKVL